MKRFLILSLFSFGVLFAQNLPNCSQALTFTGIHAGAAIPSTAGASQGCAGWRLTWQVTGFTGATIQLEGSQDNFSWAAFSGALVVEGSNPTSWASSTVSNTIVVRASLPYVRVNVTGVTGTGSIKTLVLGYSGTSAQWDAGGGGGGTPGGAVTSIQFNNGGVFGGAIGSQVDSSGGSIVIAPTSGNAFDDDVDILGDSLGSTALYVRGGGPGVNGAGYGILASGSNGGTALHAGTQGSDATGGNLHEVLIDGTVYIFGANITGDTATGLSLGIDSSFGIGAPELIGYKIFFNLNGTESNVHGYHADTPSNLGTVSGVAAAFYAEDWGVGNYAYYNAGQSLAKPEGTVTQTNLGTVPVGAFVFCSDCTVVTCAASGSGAWVFGTASGNVCPF